VSSDSPAASGRLTRRRLAQRGLTAFAGTSLLGSFLAACGNQSDSSAGASGSGSSSSASSGPRSMQTSWVPDAEFLGYFIAVENGYYEKAGLGGFKVLPGGPDISPESILASGKTMLSLSEPDLTASVVVKKKAPFKIIGAQYQKNPIGIMSLPKTGIHGPKDLVGKKVGVPAANRLTISALLKANGIDEKDVKIVPYSFDPTPVANGELDAAIAFVTTDPYLLLDKGIKTSTFLLQDFGVPLYNDAIVVTEDDLKNRRKDLVAFMKASAMGWNEAINNTTKRTTYLELITKKYGKSLGQSLASQKYQMESQVALMQTDLTKQKGFYWMDDAGIQGNLATMEQLKIKADKSLFDTSILEEVYADGPTVSL
jgi:ABC-type nitrate/sulfonate/bicarbonate transport system substrate-binding protein